MLLRARPALTMERSAQVSSLAHAWGRQCAAGSARWSSARWLRKANLLSLHCHAACYGLKSVKCGAQCIEPGRCCKTDPSAGSCPSGTSCPADGSYCCKLAWQLWSAHCGSLLVLTHPCLCLPVSTCWASAVQPAAPLPRLSSARAPVSPPASAAPATLSWWGPRSAHNGSTAPLTAACARPSQLPTSARALCWGVAGSGRSGLAAVWHA